MERKEKQTSAFWKAAILTIVIFLLGVLLGYYLEKGRIEKIEKELIDTDIEWADAKLQSLYYQIMEKEECGTAIDENIIFADKIYEQGIKLQKYEDANQLSEKMITEKKKYALLKAEFWINSILLKKKCNAEYKNIVYFFKNEPSIAEEEEQRVQSIVLRNIKEKYGPDVMLIPLPFDLEISTIEIMKKTYGINKAPSILIDENIKLDEIMNQEEIEKYL